jgi:hypothetical protein
MIQQVIAVIPPSIHALRIGSIVGSVESSQQLLHWLVMSSVSLVMIGVTAYRIVARLFDLGPSDT